MKYESGELVHPGDRVAFGAITEGEVFDIVGSAYVVVDKDVGGREQFPVDSLELVEKNA